MFQVLEFLSASEKNLSIHFLKNLQNTFECITSRKIIKTLYALHLLKISNPNELHRIVGLDSRYYVVYHLVKAENAGLVMVKSNKDPDYRTYQKFWKNQFPNTHKNTKLFFPTIELEKILNLVKPYTGGLYPKEIMMKLKDRGDQFDRFNKIIKEDQLEKEKFAMNTIGACKKCRKAITKEDLKNKRAQYMMEDLYCKDCIDLMFEDGSIRKLVKTYNNKNGNPKSD